MDDADIPEPAYDADDLEAVAADRAEEAEAEAGKKPKRTGDRTPTELDRRIGRWIAHFRVEAGYSLRGLAPILTARTPLAKWGASRINATELADGRATYDDVHEILHGLNVEPVVFYQKAGLIKLPASTLDMLEIDPAIDDFDRESLMVAYRRAVQAHRQATTKR